MRILLDGLWQAPLIALATWLLVRVALRTNAATRYAAWSAALAACAIFPVVTAPRGSELPVPHWALAAIAWAWALGAAMLLLRAAVGVGLLSRIKRRAVPLDPLFRGGSSRAYCATIPFRDVRLCVSDEADAPVAAGLFDAAVVLPEWLVREASAEELDRCVLHECAHLRRYDDWTKLLQEMVQAVLFFNPAVRWIAAQMDVEREIACDDAAAGREDEAVAYAACLTRMARSLLDAKRLFLAPNLFGSRKTLSLRVEHLLERRERYAGIAPHVPAACVALLAALFFAVRALTPVASLALALPQDDPTVHRRAEALYERLAAGRYGSSGFTTAEETLKRLGPVTAFSLMRADRSLSGATFVYDVRTQFGTAKMRVRSDARQRITAFTIAAKALGEPRGGLQTFITTEPGNAGF